MQHIHNKSYLETSSKDDLPSTLRILAVDLPEMRTEAFQGMCRLAHSGIYVDDVAPPKVVTFQGAGNGTHSRAISNSSQHSRAGGSGADQQDEIRLYVAQKALVKVRYAYADASNNSEQINVRFSSIL